MRLSCCRPRAAPTRSGPTPIRRVAHNPLMRTEQAVVEPLLAQLRATRALDVGTGSGRYLPLLASTGASVGPRPRLLAGDARRAAPAARRVCADACRLPFRRGVVRPGQRVADGRRRRGPRRLDARDGARARARRPPGLLGLSSVVGAARLAPHVPRRRRRSCTSSRIIPHAIDEHLAALEHAGLRVRAIREPRFTERR